MKCTNCGMENWPGSSFCRRCGKHLRVGGKSSKPGAGPPPVEPLVRPEKKPGKDPDPSRPPIPADPSSAQVSGGAPVFRPDPEPAGAAFSKKTAPPTKKTSPPPPEKKRTASVSAGKKSISGSPAVPAEGRSSNGSVRVRVTPRRRLAPLAAALILIAGAGLIWRFGSWPADNTPPGNPTVAAAVSVSSEPGPPRVAVLRFSNRSGIESWNIWERGAVHGLNLLLAQSPRIEVVPLSGLFHGLERLGKPDGKGLSETERARLSEFTGAGLILQGDFSRVDDGFEFHVVLEDVDGGKQRMDRVFSARTEDDLLPLFTTVAKEVVSSLTGSSDFDTWRPETEIITPDGEAFKHFVRGKDLCHARSFLDGSSALEQAVALDSGFVPARMALAEAYRRLGRPGPARKILQESQALIERVSVRGRYHLQGEFYGRSEKTYDIAASIYQRLLETHPGDLSARASLVVLEQKLGRRRPSSRSELGTLPWAGVPPERMFELWDAFGAEAESQPGERILREFASCPSLRPEIAVREALGRMLRADLDGAWKRINRLKNDRFRTDVSRTRGEILQLRGDLAAAESEYARLLDQEDVGARLWGRRRLMGLLAQEGRFDQALKEAEDGLALARISEEPGWVYDLCLESARLLLQDDRPEQALAACDSAWEVALQGETSDFPRKALLYRGLAELRLNRLQEARTTSEALRGMCEKGPSPDRMRDYFHLSGGIAMAGENISLARDYFTRAVDRLPPEGGTWRESDDHAFHLDALASLLYRSRQSGEAEEAYKKLTALTSGRLAFGDLYARSLYMQGLLAVSEGDGRGAGRHFRRFLEAWSEADHDREELRDARRRITALQ